LRFPFFQRESIHEIHAIHYFSTLRLAALATSGAAFASGTMQVATVTGVKQPLANPACRQAGRTITIEMSDNMRYTPSNIQVKQGETVRFVVKNVGQVSTNSAWAPRRNRWSTWNR
jgi:uncharacterized cupredoxin-like copper-binding protein